MMANATALLIDDREKLSCIDLLREYASNNPQITIKEERLSVGDFQIYCNGTCRWIIERKTTHDFRQSIIDKRIFNQLQALLDARKQMPECNIGILLEGTPPPNFTEGRPNYLAIITMLNRWRDFHKITIFRTNSLLDTAMELFGMLNDLSKRNLAKTPFTPQPPITKPAKAMYVIEDWMYLSMLFAQFPQISPQRANEIAKKFNGSIYDAVSVAKNDPELFKSMIADENSSVFKRKVPQPTVDLIYRVLSH